jgi:hypothetical protein
MEFDKCQALDLFEDALMDAHHEYGRGVALGLASAFYMCRLFTHAEWKAMLNRIPKSTRQWTRSCRTKKGRIAAALAQM